jgi:hypothetical protein
MASWVEFPKLSPTGKGLMETVAETMNRELGELLLPSQTARDVRLFRRRLVPGEPAASLAPLVFAYYVTGHGYGHATRVVEVRIGGWSELWNLMMIAVVSSTVQIARLFLDWLIQSWNWQVARHLCLAGHEVHIVTAAPEFVFTRDIPSRKLHSRKVRVLLIASLDLVLGSLLEEYFS